MSLLETAQDFIAQGISVIPVVLATKKPGQAWKAYQTHIMDDETAARRFSGLNGEHGIALICGRVSGGLEVIDFDNHLGNIAETFKAFIMAPAVNAIVFGQRLPYEKSPSGGYHIWYRCETIGANTKIASVPTPGQAHASECIIETRGEGGYCLCAPSRNYTLLSGSMSYIPTISAGDRQILLDAAKSFDQMPAAAPAPTQSQPKKANGFTPVLPGSPAGESQTRPGDDYSNDGGNAEECRQLMREQGWTLSHSDAGNEYWCRPGKDKKDGHSASFNGSVLNVFSSNAAPFEAKAYGLYQVFAMLRHGGDFAAAARELGQRGLGTRSTAGAPVPFRPEDKQDGFIIIGYDHKTGEVKYSIDYERFIAILNDAGFRIYVHGKDVRILRVQTNIAEEVFMSDVIAYALSLCPDPSVRNFLIKSETRLFTIGKLLFLKSQSDDFLRSTSGEAWLYFKNHAVMVTKEGYTLYDYSELTRPVWKNKIMARDINPEFFTTEESEISTFIKNVSGGSGARMKLLMTAIGYLLHDFKQMANTRAIIFTDEKIPDSEDDANGGTGKSILAKYVKYYRNTAIISGKSTDFKDSFFYQSVGYDTDLVLFDDVGKKFPFSYLFDVITGDLTVNKKNMPSFVLPFEQSPKFILTTNYTILGTGSSFDRRKLEIEFSSYYGPTRTPATEFGHQMFDEWTREEWNRADAFALECLQLFLSEGLVPNESILGATRIRQAINETRQDFIDFMMDEIEEDRIVSGIEFERKDLYSRYKASLDDSSEEKLAGFTRRISKFCTIFKIKCASERRHNSYYTTLYGDLKMIVANFRSKVH